MLNRDFFIGHARWTAEEVQEGGLRFVFEAGFSEPSEGTGFSYVVRGVFRRDKNSEYRGHHEKPTEIERLECSRLIERSALSAAAAIESEALAKTSPLSNESQLTVTTAGMDSDQGSESR